MVDSPKILSEKTCTSFTLFGKHNKNEYSQFVEQSKSNL